MKDGLTYKKTNKKQKRIVVKLLDLFIIYWNGLECKPHLLFCIYQVFSLTLYSPLI